MSGKSQGIAREFDFGQNVREMSGNFASDCDIYGKSPQFHEIILRRCHTPAFILSVGYMGPIILPSLNLFLNGFIWFVVRPPNAWEM